MGDMAVGEFLDIQQCKEKIQKTKKLLKIIKCTKIGDISIDDDFSLSKLCQELHGIHKPRILYLRMWGVSEKISKLNINQEFVQNNAANHC